MKHGPGIAAIAALIGDPARANMLTALLHGAALTPSELALEAGVTKQTVSSHLSKLSLAGLISTERQGRHRYYRLADREVAGLLETLMGVAARTAPPRARPGPKEPALRHARVCYDHLAGALGVALYDALLSEKWLSGPTDALTTTRRGAAGLSAFGVDLELVQIRTRPLCRACLDWSVRRNHLAGALGAAMLTRMFDLGWARRLRESRVVEFSPAGERALARTFKLGSLAP